MTEAKKVLLYPVKLQVIWAKAELCIQDLPLWLHDVPSWVQEHICLFTSEHVRQSSLSIPYNQASETTNTAAEALKWEGGLILAI